MKWKELEDYPWFPKKLRQFQMEFIGFVVQKFGVLKSLPAIINSLLQAEHLVGIVDLCSGSGLPSAYIKDHLKRDIPMVLSDKFPPDDFELKGLRFLSQSVDVLDLVPEKSQLYTMCNAFHHFDAKEQTGILQKFKAHNGSLLITEVLVPSFFTLIQIVLVSTIGQLLVAPFIKPFSPLRIIFTYLVPINLITVLTDGIISVFKSKTQQYYQQLFRELQSEDYQIVTQTIINFPNKIITIIAKPIHANT